MKCVRREDLTPLTLQARQIWRVYGENAAVDDRLSYGFAHFAPEYGPMKPHKHEREWIYVLDAHQATARYGTDFGSMNSSSHLKAGDFLRFEDQECHVFEFGSNAGYLDILWGFEIPMNHTVEAE